MANKTIGQLTAKTTPSSADVFAMEDTEDTKKINYDALADAILNKITSKNYTVAGSSQTLINAINTLNSNGLYDRGLLRQNVDLNDLQAPGLYYCSAESGSNFPSSGLTYSAALIEVSSFANSGGICQVCIDAVGTSKRIWRRYFVNNAWSDWVQQPERQEITDLNSKQTYNAGEKLYIGGNNAMYAGRIGWGGLEIWFNVPIDKPIASNVTTATLTLNGNIYACTGTQAVQINNKISGAICYIGAGGRNFLSIRFNLSSNPLTVSDAGLNVMLSSTLSEVVLS